MRAIRYVVDVSRPHAIIGHSRRFFNSPLALNYLYPLFT